MFQTKICFNETNPTYTRREKISFIMCIMCYHKMLNILIVVFPGLYRSLLFNVRWREKEILCSAIRDALHVKKGLWL